MPAAIPIAAAVIPSVLGAVVSNGQNKSNQQSATNAASSARQFDAQALQNALSGLSSYTAANPSPVSGLGGVTQPQSVYGGGQPQMSGQSSQQVGGSNGGQISQAPGGAGTPLAQGQGGGNIQAMIAQMLQQAGAQGAGQNTAARSPGTLTSALSPAASGARVL